MQDGDGESVKSYSSKDREDEKGDSHHKSDEGEDRAKDLGFARLVNRFLGVRSTYRS
jgi:hypothetical protein